MIRPNSYFRTVNKLTKASKTQNRQHTEIWPPGKACKLLIPRSEVFSLRQTPSKPEKRVDYQKDVRLRASFR